jgi:hypothetical protein
MLSNDNVHLSGKYIWQKVRGVEREVGAKRRKVKWER